MRRGKNKTQTERNEEGESTWTVPKPASPNKLSPQKIRMRGSVLRENSDTPPYTTLICLVPCFANFFSHPLLLCYPKQAVFLRRMSCNRVSHKILLSSQIVYTDLLRD